MRKTLAERWQERRQPSANSHEHRWTRGPSRSRRENSLEHPETLLAVSPLRILVLL